MRSFKTILNSIIGLAIGTAIGAIIKNEPNIAIIALIVAVTIIQTKLLTKD